MIDDLFLILLGTTIFWIGCVVGYAIGYYRRARQHHADLKEIDALIRHRQEATIRDMIRITNNGHH